MANGYEPDTTPVDVLMAAPAAVGLAVADAMDDDGDYPDDTLAGFQDCDDELLLNGNPDLDDFLPAELKPRANRPLDAELVPPAPYFEAHLP